MRTIWRKAKPKEEKRFKLNEEIRVPEVFLIDETGANVGVMETSKAMAMARENGLDLVEVNPKAQPPIVKIIDYGQFKYEKDKQAHRQKTLQKKVDIKGIRLSLRISDNDLNIRLEQAKKFLEKGHKLKIELGLRGRERQHPAKAAEIMKGFYDALAKTPGFSLLKEQDLTKQGERFNMIVVNKK